MGFDGIFYKKSIDISIYAFQSLINHQNQNPILKLFQ